jgi:hypothetical protein
MGLILAFDIDPCGDANEKMRRIGVCVCVFLTLGWNKPKTKIPKKLLV